MSISKIFQTIKNIKVKKKRAAGMNFENFAARIATSNQIENFEMLKNEYKEQQRFSIIGGEMQKTSMLKSKFSQANDKRFYKLKRITSLPIDHPYLKEGMAYKEKKGELIEKYFIEGKDNLKKKEIEAFSRNERLTIYNQMLCQNFQYYDLNDSIKLELDNLKTNFSQSTQSYILESKWI